MSPFSPHLPSSSKPRLPLPEWPSPHCCLCLWVTHACSLASPFTFFHSVLAPVESVSLFCVSMPLFLFCLSVYFDKPPILFTEYSVSFKRYYTKFYQVFLKYVSVFSTHLLNEKEGSVSFQADAEALQGAVKPSLWLVAHGMLPAGGMRRGHASLHHTGGPIRLPYQLQRPALASGPSVSSSPFYSTSPSKWFSKRIVALSMIQTSGTQQAPSPVHPQKFWKHRCL